MKSPLQTLTPVRYLAVLQQPGAKVTQELPRDWNAFIYVIAGTVAVGELKENLQRYWGGSLWCDFQFVCWGPQCDVEHCRHVEHRRHIKYCRHGLLSSQDHHSFFFIHPFWRRFDSTMIRPSSEFKCLHEGTMKTSLKLNWVCYDGLTQNNKEGY